MEFHLEELEEQGEGIPEPHSYGERLEVDAAQHVAQPDARTGRRRAPGDALARHGAGE